MKNIIDLISIVFYSDDINKIKEYRDKVNFEEIKNLI